MPRAGRVLEDGTAEEWKVLQKLNRCAKSNRRRRRGTRFQHLEREVRTDAAVVQDTDAPGARSFRTSRARRGDEGPIQRAQEWPETAVAGRAAVYRWSERGDLNARPPAPSREVCRLDVPAAQFDGVVPSRAAHMLLRQAAGAGDNDPVTHEPDLCDPPTWPKDGMGGPSSHNLRNHTQAGRRIPGPGRPIPR